MEPFIEVSLQIFFCLEHVGGTHQQKNGSHKASSETLTLVDEIVFIFVLCLFDKRSAIVMKSFAITKSRVIRSTRLLRAGMKYRRPISVFVASSARSNETRQTHLIFCRLDTW